MKALVQKLVETSGPSGFEANIRQVVRTEIEPLADEIQVDALGNLIARLGPRGKSAPAGDARQKIMLAAHMDEIGVIVTHIDDNGFARFTTLGGVQARNLTGGRVRFTNGAAGVIGIERLERITDLPTIQQMFIDLGASERKACPVQVGDVAVFERPLAEMGTRLVAKSLDDRIGMAVLIEVMRQMKSTPHELYFVFSVQEEVGIRGATTAAFGIDPHLGLAVDVTATGDTPKGLTMEVSLGKGPAIKVRDEGMLSDPRVVSWMSAAAEKAKIPYQLEILERGTTDARMIQISRAGVPSGCISIPCRYVHTPSEMVDLRDVQHAVQLLLELLSQPVNLG